MRIKQYQISYWFQYQLIYYWIRYVDQHELIEYQLIDSLVTKWSITKFITD